MIEKLTITNYRLIKNLTIDSINNVNLITGKNNTGKSSLLEAIAIVFSNGSIPWLKNIINIRGEELLSSERNSLDSEKLLNGFSTFFYNRNKSFRNNNIRFVSSYFKSQDKKTIDISFVYFVEPLRNGNLFEEYIRNEIDSDTVFNHPNASQGIKITVNNTTNIYSAIDKIFTYPISHELSSPTPIFFISARNFNNLNTTKLWDKIALTDKESYVVESLKIIEPLLDKITFIESDNSKRFAVIRLTTGNEVLPIASMGDGINRILSIILAMVNAENGVVLIDEFEKGLHYTVQEKLWQIIFKLSEQLNIQVFATTHSRDCIKSYSKIMNKPGFISLAKLFRLDKKNEVIKTTEFTGEELEIASQNNIEIR